MSQDPGAKTIILYGDTGVGKSLNARFFAMHLYETYHKPVILVSAEGSSRNHFQGLIDLGIVIPMYLTSQYANSAMRKLGKGQWRFNIKGKPEWRSMFGADNSPFGAIFEGLTSIANLCVKGQADVGALPASKDEGVGTFDEDGEHFGLVNRRNMYQVQNEMLSHLTSIDSLPFKRVLWTAHEYKGSEDQGLTTLLGPGLVGKARTGDVAKYAAVVLHFETYSYHQDFKDPSTGESMPVCKQHRRIWFERHPDSRTGVMFPAKLTLSSKAAHDAVWGKFPGGYFTPGMEPGSGVDGFIKFLDRVSAPESLAEWKAKVDTEIPGAAVASPEAAPPTSGEPKAAAAESGTPTPKGEGQGAKK